MTPGGHLPFALPDVGEAEIAAVSDAIRSGWLSSGPKVKEFEREFAAAIGEDLVAISVNSATAGLHLSLEALGVGPGDEVLVPTWTFTATAEVCRYLGAVPVLVDSEPRTLNMDFRDAAAKVTSRTKAIMPVHFAGHPIPHTEIRGFAEQHRLAVVEDAAHAFPSTAEGTSVGGGSSATSVFSFYATKTMTTGEGGMIVTRDREIAERIRVMRLHGISRDAFDRYRSEVPSWHYEVVAPGFKYNLTDPAAAMGLVQLRRSADMRDRRAAIASRYNDAFQKLPLELPAPPPADASHSWHLYVVRLAEGNSARAAFIDAMGRAGVACSVHFIPLHLHPCWREAGSYDPGDFPVATKEFGRVVSLPIFSSMTDEDVERVIHAVQTVMKAS